MNNKQLHTFIQHTLNDCVFGEKDFIRTSELEQLCSANGKNADSLYKNIEELIKYLIYFKKAKEKKDFRYQAKLRPRIYSISRELEVPEQIITEIFQKIRGTEVSSIIIDYQVDKSVEKGKGEKDEDIKQQSADKDKILFPKEKVKYSNQTSNDSSRRKNEEEDEGEKRLLQLEEKRQMLLTEEFEIKHKQYFENANNAKSFATALVWLQKIPKNSRYYGTAIEKIADINAALNKQEADRQYDQTLLDAKTKIAQQNTDAAQSLLLSIPKDAKACEKAQTLLKDLGERGGAEKNNAETKLQQKNQKKYAKWIAMTGSTFIFFIIVLYQIGRYASIEPMPEPIPTASAEQRDWVALQNKLDASVDDYESFMEHYPVGHYYAEAQGAIRKIEDAIRKQKKKQEAEAKQKDKGAWDKAKQTNSIRAYQDYMKSYPNGAFIEQAKGKAEYIEMQQQITKQKEEIRIAQEMEQKGKTDREKIAKESVSLKRYNAAMSFYRHGEEKLKVTDYEDACSYFVKAYQLNKDIGLRGRRIFEEKADKIKNVSDSDFSISILLYKLAQNIQYKESTQKKIDKCKDLNNQ